MSENIIIKKIYLIYRNRYILFYQNVVKIYLTYKSILIKILSERKFSRQAGVAQW